MEQSGGPDIQHEDFAKAIAEYDTVGIVYYGIKSLAASTFWHKVQPTEYFALAAIVFEHMNRLSPVQFHNLFPSLEGPPTSTEPITVPTDYLMTYVNSDTYQLMVHLKDAYKVQHGIDLELLISQGESSCKSNG